MLHARWVRNQEGKLVAAWDHDQAPSRTAPAPTPARSAQVIFFPHQARHATTQHHAVMAAIAIGRDPEGHSLLRAI